MRPEGSDSPAQSLATGMRCQPFSGPCIIYGSFAETISLWCQRVSSVSTICPLSNSIVVSLLGLHSVS